MRFSHFCSPLIVNFDPKTYSMEKSEDSKHYAISLKRLNNMQLYSMIELYSCDVQSIRDAKSHTLHKQ